MKGKKMRQKQNQRIGRESENPRMNGKTNSDGEREKTFQNQLQNCDIQKKNRTKKSESKLNKRNNDTNTVKDFG